MVPERCVNATRGSILSNRTVAGIPNVLEVCSAPRWNYVNGLFLIMMAPMIFESNLSKSVYV